MRDNLGRFIKGFNNSPFKKNRKECEVKEKDGSIYKFRTCPKCYRVVPYTKQPI